jgi:hypothetical protein
MPRGRKPKNKEESLQIALSRYIKLKFPDVVFTAESSGVRVTIGTAVKMKKQRSVHKLPDMIILQPSGKFHGLVLELKDGRDKVYKKDGTFLNNKHVQAQLKTLKHLSKIGYYACFVCDIDDGMSTVAGYMKLK